MGEKLPWILMGGGTAVILVTSWCRILLDVDRIWFFAALVLGLGMVIGGKLLHSKCGKDNDRGDE